jgi:hypothetical protein
VLPGDFDDTVKVVKGDATAVRAEWQGTAGAHPTVFGEILGDGTVNVGDYNAVRKRVGTMLPKLGSAKPKFTLARSLASQHVQ